MIQIRRLDMSDPKVRAEFERILAKVDEQFKPLTDAIRKSQRLSARDFNITINVK